MRAVRRFTTIFLLGGLLAASVAAGQVRSAVPAMRSDTIAETQISRLRAEWIQALEGKQLDEAMGLYAFHATFYSPGATPVAGLPAIRSLFDTVMKTYDADIHMHSTGLAVSGALAYDGGDYQDTLTNRQTRAKANLRGSYLMVLRCGADGRWKIVEHMWTQAPPA